MDLWTEFEGATIDSAFALKKLLQTEGRSAFFSTVNGKGESVLIRIIECHFDEDDILARWRGVQALGHPNFLCIDHFGQFLIEADDITAVYAVFERVDANLGQVLGHGRLSAADAAQIGLSIGSALETLHEHGFVHEHVEPANIYAVGETVKLRSDCIRETPDDEAGFEARRRDALDLAFVLKQVLEGSLRTFDGPRQPALPAPFDDILRNVMSGEWGLTEIKAALTDAASAPRKATARPSPQAVSATRLKPHDIEGMPIPARIPDRIPSPPAPPAEPHAARPDLTDGPSPYRGAFSRREPVSFEPPAWASRLKQLDKRWIGAAVLLFAALLFGWMLLRRPAGSRAGETTPSAPAARTRPVAETTPAAPRGRSAPLAASHSGTQWRVVAFTYNRRDQAQKKAAWLAQRHPGIAADAFSPNGKAPWLVTIGGPLDHDAAYALAHKARSLGLPSDTYAQNYALR